MAAVARTVVKVKPGQMDAVRQFGKAQSSRISSIPGLIGWGWAETAETEFTLIVVYNDRAAAESAAGTASGIFAEMASMVAAPPQREILDGEWFAS